MNIILMLIIWTWGLTPVWVNVLTTILCSINILAGIAKAVIKILDEKE